MTTRAEEIAGEGPYTYRLSILVPDMCQIEDSEGNCVGLLRTPHDANTLCKELNAAYKQGQQDAQPSAPTVERIMEVVEPIAYEAMLKARSWQFMPIIQHADIDDTLREPLHAALTKLLNP